jgi:TetR/AcrR family transcriptional repressor of bet genes
MPKVVDREQRRQELIEATWAVVASEGLDALTMRRIAEEAECTTGRITHYFVDRDDLLVAALRRAHEAAGKRMLAAFAAESDPRRRLRAVLEQALPLDATSTAEWKVWIAFWGFAMTDRRLAREDARRYREWNHLLVETLRGLVAAQHVDEVAHILIASIDGLGLRAAIHPSAATRRSVLAALDALLERLDLH